MTENSENEKAETGFGDFASAALRGPRKGTKQTLIAHHLVAATFAIDQSKVFYHVCSAAMHVRPEEIKKLDLELMKNIFTVNQAVTKAKLTKAPLEYFYGSGWTYREVYSILWSFEKTKENFDKYIAPWQKVGFSYWGNYLEDKTSREKIVYATCKECRTKILRIRNAELDKEGKTIQTVMMENPEFHVKRLMQKVDYNRPLGHAHYTAEEKGLVCPKCGAEDNAISFERAVEPVKEDYFIFFFKSTYYLMPIGYETIKQCFEDWAHPIVMDAKALLSDFVTSDVLKEAIDTFRKQASGEFEESASAVDPRE